RAISAIAQELLSGSGCALGEQDRIEQSREPRVEIGSAQTVDDHHSPLAALDQAGAPQHVVMVRHGRARYLTRRRIGAGEPPAAPGDVGVEATDDREARRIGQSVKHARQRNVFEIGMNEPGHGLDIETYFKISKIPLFGYLELMAHASHFLLATGRLSMS